MGCCSSSPIEDLRAPLLAPSSAQQPAAAAESYPPSLNYNSSSSASASTSSSYHHPPVPTSVHAQHQHNASAKSEAAPADNELDAKAQTTEENESDEPSLTASGLRVIDAPRPEGATEHMTKEEEFEFYKKKMEQLNREKEDTNARFLKEEREKQKLLDKQHKKPSLLTFFKSGEEEEEAEFAIGAPQGFKHESHIGWTPEGGFDIFNVPNEWKKLMSKAGVTEEQMQDKETAMFIVSFVASTLGNQQGGQAAAQAPAAHPVQAEERREGEAEVQVSPSENSQPAEQERPGEEEEESIPSAPPAPLAPAPAQPALGGSSAPPPPPVLRPSVAEEGSSGDMFSAIRGGVALKKVAALPDVKNLSVQEEDSIAGALARALQSRRFAIREEEEEPEEEDNGEWDD